LVYGAELKSESQNGNSGSIPIPTSHPAASVDRAWIPSQSVRVANVAAAKVEELRNLGEINGL
jgi:hypothetical protein